MAENAKFTYTISMAHIKKVKDVDEFLTFMRNPNLKEYTAYLAKNKVVVNWSLDANPHDAEALMELDFPLWKELAKAIAENFRKLSE